MSTTDEAKFWYLKKFNLATAFVHLFQGILILIISVDFSVPIKATYLTEESGKLFQETKVLFDIQLGPLIALFLFLAALDHFLVATVRYDWYVKNLKNKINYARWIEYSFSASVMIIIIAMLSGIYDVGSLIAIFALTAVMSLCGMVMEVHNQTTKDTKWISYIVGCIAGIVPWLVIGLYFYFSETSGGDIPRFVYVIYITLALLYNSFAINMYLQYKKWGPWNDYLFGEKVYIILSLIAKSALAWQVYGGTRGGPSRA
jgi:hypothetical protein